MRRKRQASIDRKDPSEFVINGSYSSGEDEGITLNLTLLPFLLWFSI